MKQLIEIVGKGLRSQWLAGALIIPIILLSINAWVANDQARIARQQAVRTESISRLQESGKDLDAALANYFNSVAQLGLSERGIAMPGSYEVVSIKEAKNEVITSRRSVSDALIAHAGDVQALRGTLDPYKTQQYNAELTDVRRIVDQPAEIENTGMSVTSLSDLIVARNGIVDEALEKAS